MHSRLIEQKQIFWSCFQQTHHATQAAAKIENTIMRVIHDRQVSLEDSTLRRYAVLMIAKWCVIPAYGLTRNSYHFRKDTDRWFSIWYISTFSLKKKKNKKNKELIKTI